MNHENWPVFLKCISPLMGCSRPMDGFFGSISLFPRKAEFQIPLQTGQGKGIICHSTCAPAGSRPNVGAGPAVGKLNRILVLMELTR